MNEIADRPGPESEPEPEPEAESRPERHRKPTSWLKILSGWPWQRLRKRKSPASKKGRNKKTPESVYMYMYKKTASRTPHAAAAAVAGGCTTTGATTATTTTTSKVLPRHAHRVAQHVKYIPGHSTPRHTV